MTLTEKATYGGSCVIVRVWCRNHFSLYARGNLTNVFRVARFSCNKGGTTEIVFSSFDFVFEQLSRDFFILKWLQRQNFMCNAQIFLCFGGENGRKRIGDV